MYLLLKATANYFKKSFNFLSGDITKLEYIVGVIVSWLLLRGVNEVKSLLKMSEECDADANKFCLVEAQLYNGFIEVIMLLANLYIIIALIALVNREMIAIGKYKQIFRNSFIIRTTFILLLYLFFSLFFRGLAPLLFAILYFEPRETNDENK